MKTMRSYCRRQLLFWETLAMCLSIAGFFVWMMWTVIGELLERIMRKLDKAERNVKALSLFL